MRLDEYQWSRNPRGMHNQGVFRGICNQTDAELPNSVEFAETALSLPVYPQLANEEVEYVIEAVKGILEKNRKKLYYKGVKK